MSMPQAVKTRNGTLKYILKRAVRGVIPDQLIDRPKQGFGVPVYEWFFDRLGEYSKHHLDLFCKRTDYFDRCEVDRLIESKRGPEVWYLLNFALWWNEYID
jgi:asparagine synthase (glutamine-hydrolysing)